ncbi:hypothetical protein G4V62_14000 [Bacillaceae bacterium SIJ1]|uniref:hypothetical protein n=1 Tax=Litoribacterium kuwaitense TaxID=1398745 RepID=UPI0013ECF2B7|nr:hypothetical protein [Litoribacterium kuwaitense]NGP46007.1 hypothetical protein [Litoribacterium kuwaitense]
MCKTCKGAGDMTVATAVMAYIQPCVNCSDAQKQALREQSKQDIEALRQRLLDAEREARKVG